MPLLPPSYLTFEPSCLSEHFWNFESPTFILLNCEALLPSSYWTVEPSYLYLIELWSPHTFILPNCRVLLPSCFWTVEPSYLFLTELLSLLPLSCWTDEPFYLHLTYMLSLLYLHFTGMLTVEPPIPSSYWHVEPSTFIVLTCWASYTFILLTHWASYLHLIDMLSLQPLSYWLVELSYLHLTDMFSTPNFI